ncbi:hypothetical protein AAZX31_06G185800 [Glycine max]
MIITYVPLRDPFTLLSKNFQPMIKGGIPGYFNCISSPPFHIQSQIAESILNPFMSILNPQFQSKKSIHRNEMKLQLNDRFTLHIQFRINGDERERK